MCRGARLRSWATAGFWLAAVIWPSAEALAQRAVGEQKELLPVKVYQLITETTSMQPVVLLADPLEERVLPVWIGPCEANAINGELEGIKHPRPLTHDLLERVMQKANGKVQKVVVTHSKEGTYYATFVMEKEGSVIEIDARPSDSIVMALKFKAPIFVSKKLFNDMSISLGERKGIEQQYGLTVQDLTPQLAQSFSFPSTRGALVSDVREGSPAEKDGIQRGDIFVEVGGEKVEDVMSLKAALAKRPTPSPAKVFRKGDYRSILLHLK